MDLKEIVHSDPEIVSGTPVFVGTRVPVKALLDYLEGGETIEEFLDDFPSVSREQAVAVAALNEPVTLADRFDEIRQVFHEENAHLRVPPRRDRKNDFVSVLDELSDGHKISSK